MTGLLKRPALMAVLAYVAVRCVVVLTLHLAAERQGRDAHRLLVRWDGQWYRAIAENGYGATSVVDGGRQLSDYAFFPLFPLLERGLASVTGLAAAEAGLVVSGLCSALAAWGIFTVAASLYGDRTGVAASILWGLLPIGVVQSMAYSESLFTALAAWALSSLLAGRWLLAGTLACLAGLTRPIGAAVVAAVIVAAVQHFRDQAHHRSPASSIGPGLHPLAASLLAPVGWIVYVGWVGFQVGSPAGYFAVQEKWGNGVDGGMAVLRWTWALLTGSHPVQGVLVLLGAATVFVLFCFCIKDRQPAPLLVFSGFVLASALITSGYFGSRPRYVMPAFPLLLPVARLWARQRPWVFLWVFLGLAATACTYGTVWLLGDGPP